jgi:hypothetical protein
VGAKVIGAMKTIAAQQGSPISDLIKADFAWYH